MKKSLLSKIMLFCLTAVALTGCNKGKDKPGSDPSEPTDPVQPVDPVDPVDPTDPVDPVEPVDTTYSFTFNGTLCTANNLTEYDKGSQVSITITPDFDCVLPEDVTVTGVETYQFSNETGVLSFVITNDVTVTCVCSRNVYGIVTFNLEHMSAECGERYLVNSEVTAVLTPDEEYKLPSEADIVLTNATLISYSEVTGNLTFKVLGDVIIAASAIYVPIASRVISTLANCNISLSKQYNVHDEFIETITPDDGYKLPDSIVVTGLAEGYTYNKDTGVISGTIVDKTVTIQCSAIQIYYSFKFIGKYCTVSSFSDKYKANETVSITITPNSGYEFDTSMLKVVGVDDYEFSKETGVLTVIMTNDVVVNCECKNVKLYYIFYNLEHITATGSNGYPLNYYATIYLTADDGYKLPE